MKKVLWTLGRALLPTVLLTIPAIAQTRPVRSRLRGIRKGEHHEESSPSPTLSLRPGNAHDLRNRVRVGGPMRGQYTPRHRYCL